MTRIRLELLNIVCGVLVIASNIIISATNKVLVKRNYLLLVHPKKPERNFNLKEAQQ